MTTDRNCLDAETVAAWMDGGLDATGVAAAEAHASTCERCQALLATVVKTLPMDDPLALRHEARGTARFWKWWLAPIAATAAAVTIWMVVPQTPMQPPATTQTARDMTDAPAKAQPQAPPAEFAQQAPATASPAPPARDNSRRNVPAAPQQSQNKLADSAANAAKLDAEALGRQDKREEAKARAEMRQAAEPAPAPATAAAGTSAERMREAPANPSIGAVAQLRKQTAPLQIVSPDPSRRWRVLTGGIERSEDGGRIWIPVRLAGNEVVIGGASPGPFVCWLIGQNGLVLLATDGTNFTRLRFPESVDLVAVSASDARTATITTADGRTFTTEDAGRTWRQQ